MSKQVKILTTVIMVIMVIATISNVVLASNPGQVISNFKPNYSDTTKVTDMGQRIVGILQVLGIVVAIVVLTIVGIKYMMGSAEEKAEYKKVMIPYIVGAILVFGATTIVNVVYQIATSATGSALQ